MKQSEPRGKFTFALFPSRFPSPFDVNNAGYFSIKTELSSTEMLTSGDLKSARRSFFHYPPPPHYPRNSKFPTSISTPFICGFHPRGGGGGNAGSGLQVSDHELGTEQKKKNTANDKVTISLKLLLTLVKQEPSWDLVQIRVLVCKYSFEFLLQHEQRVVCLWFHIFDVPSYGQ